EHGTQIMGRLKRAPRFNSWMADLIRPHCGTRVLEIGSGTGAITRQLVPRRRYVATDVNPLHLATLRALRSDRPYLDAQFCDITDLETYPRGEERFDTVIALNVIEHVERDREALVNIRSILAPGGRAIVLVPQGAELFGSLDEVLGHKRRYSEAALRRLAAEAGFTVHEIIRFNRIGTPVWWVNGKLFKRRTFGLFQVLALNMLTPIFRRLDTSLPFAPLSLIAVLHQSEGSAAQGNAPSPSDERRERAAEGS
ncbi:MAG TPA: class I SAM-dependent methyltransferase, partial [Anaeromyxobacteraceae bacterium]|nr:class I SAM-dependent methyltransferase [Anaeromyxobacteraceae bacterium]